MKKRLHIHWIAVSAIAVLLTGTAIAKEVTYEYDMELPIDWADVSMEWGGSGKVDFCYQEPGKHGKALHMTTKPDPNAPSPCAEVTRGAGCANEGRCIQWNHRPGTYATISFDFKVFEAQDQSWFKVYYYDGYVTGEFFQENQHDPFYAIPPAILVWNSGDSLEWQHYEIVTERLDQLVLTLWMQAANTCDDMGPIDAAIDNLSVTLELSEEFYDPNFEWGGENYDKMHTCRWTNECRHIQWCDLMYDESAPNASWDQTMIYYGSMNTFRGTSANPGLLSMKHDFWHRYREGQANGASVIGFASIHASGEAKSMGLRQTTSYTAFGLKPGEPAHVVVQTKGASSIAKNSDGVAGRTLMGVDPTGGVISTHPKVLWTEEANADIQNDWAMHTLEFDRPVDADALTVYIKWRDGQPDDDCDDKAPNGNDGWFDWVMVTVTPLPESAEPVKKSEAEPSNMSDRPTYTVNETKALPERTLASPIGMGIE
jgi:hypothetical protein